MFKTRDRNADRKIRHARVRRKISGTPEMPRLCVYRSLNNIYAQVIDDEAGRTVASASTLEQDARGTSGANVSAATEVGRRVAEKAKAAGVTPVLCIGETLAECGTSFEQVIKATVWLSDMQHFAGFNDVYKRHFDGGFPVRSTVGGAQLALGVDVEIEVQAWVGAR